MKVALWKDEKYLGNKCPMCRYLNRNFIIFEMEGLEFFVCMESNCGTMFLPKTERMNLDMLKLVEEANSKYRCDFEGCSFVARSKAGLKAHERKHDTTEN